MRPWFCTRRVFSIQTSTPHFTHLRGFSEIPFLFTLRPLNLHFPNFRAYRLGYVDVSQWVSQSITQRFYIYIDWFKWKISKIYRFSFTVVFWNTGQSYAPLRYLALTFVFFLEPETAPLAERFCNTFAHFVCTKPVFFLRV